MLKKLKPHFHALVTAFLVLYFIAPPIISHAALGAAEALMAFGVPAEAAKYITGNMVTVDSSGHLALPAASGKTIKFQVGGTTELTLSNDALTFSGASASLAFGATSGIFKVNGNTEATLGDDSLTLAGASFEIIPGATSLKFQNNADDNTNLTITDAGAITTRAGITATTGNITATAGDIILGTSGDTLQLQEATAADKCMGTVTANGTTAVPVSTTCAVTGARIFAMRSADNTGTTTAACWVTNIQNGVSFDFDCDAADDSTYHWVIFKESA